MFTFGDKKAEIKEAKPKTKSLAEVKAEEEWKLIEAATGDPVPISVMAASGQAFALEQAKTDHDVLAIKKMLAKVSGLDDTCQQLYAMEDKRDLEELMLVNTETVLEVMGYCQYSTGEENPEL
jgi:hypothetical protein